MLAKFDEEIRFPCGYQAKKKATLFSLMQLLALLQKEDTELKTCPLHGKQCSSDVAERSEKDD
jgi:hypothetical protein